MIYRLPARCSCSFLLAGTPGFEPRKSSLESDGLPVSLRPKEISEFKIYRWMKYHLALWSATACRRLVTTLPDQESCCDKAGRRTPKSRRHLLFQPYKHEITRDAMYRDSYLDVLRWCDLIG
jgi:hypothetical protein